MKVGALPRVVPALSKETAAKAPMSTPEAPVARSQSSYGASFFAASDLAGQLHRFTQVLGDRPVQNAFGARDQWSAVDGVSGVLSSTSPAVATLASAKSWQSPRSLAHQAPSGCLSQDQSRGQKQAESPKVRPTRGEQR